MDSSLPLAISLVGSIVIITLYFFFGPVPPGDGNRLHRLPTRHGK